MTFRHNDIIIFLYWLKISINLKFQYFFCIIKSNAHNSSEHWRDDFGIYVYHRSVERAREGSRHSRRSIGTQIMHRSSDKELFLSRNALYHVPSRHDSDTKIKATGCRKNGNGRCLRYEIGDLSLGMHASLCVHRGWDMFKLSIRIYLIFLSFLVILFQSPNRINFVYLITINIMIIIRSTIDYLLQLY